MKTLKQIVGIDVSKDSFHVCLGSINELQEIKLIGQTSFPNNSKGFKSLLSWVKTKELAAITTRFVLEATGVYYENLAYFLSERDCSLSVLLPNKSKYFAKSLALKTKTDKVDAAMLCRIGLERSLSEWRLPSAEFKKLKSLSREHRNLKGSIVAIKARIHALNHSYEPDKKAIRRLKQQMQLIDKQIVEVATEIQQVIANDQYLTKQFDNIEKVKGLSTITIATVVAETNGFANIENIKQLTSYAGLDIVMNQSGLYSGRSRISKKGNSHIRKALYLPAMSSIRCNQHFKQFYQRVRARHTNGKSSIIAVARKMLILIYTLWTKQMPYDPLLNVI